MPEVTIKCDQCALFGYAGLEDRIIRGAAKVLLVDCCDIMPVIAQKTGTAVADIFIKFKPHSAGSTGTGMTRSRAASAP